MKTVIDIIEMFGGLEALEQEGALCIANGPYMPLCIGPAGEGPNGHPLISVAHYFVQAGDLMADPQMDFELLRREGFPDQLFPISFTQHSTGTCWIAVYRDRDGVMIRPKLKNDLLRFAQQWNKNLRNQGFVKVAKTQAATGTRRGLTCVTS